MEDRLRQTGVVVVVVCVCVCGGGGAVEVTFSFSFVPNSGFREELKNTLEKAGYVGPNFHKDSSLMAYFETEVPVPFLSESLPWPPMLESNPVRPTTGRLGVAS